MNNQFEAIFEENGFVITKHRAGFQARKYFSNGYGVSIIPETETFLPGFPPVPGEFELAVLSHEGNGIGAHLCYDSGITDDVLRHLVPEQVFEVVSKVESLHQRADN